MAIEMTDEELKVMQLLGEAASEFFKLETEHPSDKKEFEAGIHSLQNIVLAQPGYRTYQHQTDWVLTEKDK